MRAKLIENIEFKRTGNPKESLGLGMTPERLPEFLKQFGIESKVLPTYHFPDMRDLSVRHGYLADYQISYAPQHVVEEEGWEQSGWGIADEDGVEILEPTEDVDEFIKKLLEIQYPDYESQLKVFKAKIDKLEKVKKFIDES